MRSPGGQGWSDGMRVAAWRESGPREREHRALALDLAFAGARGGPRQQPRAWPGRAWGGSVVRGR